MRILYARPEFTGEEIKAFLAETGLTSLALAKILEVDKTSLVKYINGITTDVAFGSQANKLLYLLMSNHSNIGLLRWREEDDNEDE